MASKSLPLPSGPSLLGILKKANKAFLDDEKKVQYRQKTYYDLRGTGLKREDAVTAARILLNAPKGHEMKRHDDFIKFLKGKGYISIQTPTEKQ